MDLLYFATTNLEFIRHFYDAASQPFLETLQKIDKGEAPFEPPAYGEWYEGEPAYVEEHVQAKDGLTVLGSVSLSMVQSLLMEYLKVWLRERGCALPPATENKALLIRYHRFFLDCLNIDWDKGPVKFRRLEDITLTRNAIQHQVDLMTIYADRTDDQMKRHPDSPLQDPYGFNYVDVSKVTLYDACRDVEAFCEFLESKRR